MSKQIIMYNEERNETRFAQVDDETFVIAEKEDGSFESMTYNEWEALRCRQACEQLTAQVDELDVDDAKKALMKEFLANFTESMQVKYLEGKRSWTQIYTELVEDFAKLA